MQKMQGMWVLSLGQEESLEKEMATCSSVLAYKIPLDRERCLVGYNPWGCKESDVTEQTHTHARYFKIINNCKFIYNHNS